MTIGPWEIAIILLILAVILERFRRSRYLRPFVATGFLGAYTTYSTFAVETDLLIKNGHAPIGVVYAVSSMVAGLLAVWAGIVAARAAVLLTQSRKVAGGRGGRAQQLRVPRQGLHRRWSGRMVSTLRRPRQLGKREDGDHRGEANPNRALPRGSGEERTP